jgi:autotransporter-associated beta strand protein
MSNAITINTGITGTFDTQAFANAVTGRVRGAGTLVKVGSGTLTLSGNNDYSGGTQLNAGVLTLGIANALGTGTATYTGDATIRAGIAGTFANRLALSPGVSGTFDSQAFANTLSGTISGSGTFVKIGTGVLTLSASNSFSGGTQLNAGVLAISNLGALGTGTLTFAGTSALRTATSGTIATAFVINPGVTGTFDTQAFANTLSGSITGSGTFAKMSSGTLTLPSSNSYTGGTRLNGGVLAIGDLGALGTGTVTYAGNSTLRTLVGGTLTNPLQLTPAATGTFDTQANAVVMAGTNMSGTGTFVKAGAGTLTFSTNALYSGTTTIVGGTLQLSGSYASTRFNINTPGSALVLDTSTSGTRDYGVSTTFSGSGNLIKTGTGTALWGTTAATFALLSSGTIDIQQGVFIGGSSNNENWTGNNANLNVAAGAVFGGVEASVRVNALTGSGTITSGFGTSGTFTFGVANGSGTFDGSLRNGSAQNRGWIKLGTGTQALTGLNTYTGTTSINAGVLQLGSGSTTGVLSSASNSLITGSAGGTFAINRSNSVTQGTDFPNLLTGSITFAQIGTGTTILTSTSNAYRGGTRVSAGLLRLNASNVLGSSTGSLTVNSGTLDLNGFSATVGAFSGSSAGVVTSPAAATLTASSPATTTYAGSITGSVALVKGGTGSLTLSGSSSYSRGTTLNAGTLAFGNASAFGTGTVTFGGNSVVRSALPTGTLANPFSVASGVTGTFDSQGNTNTLSGPISGPGGLALTGSGVVTLSGSNSYTGGTTLQSGTLVLGSTNALGSPTSPLAVNGGRLDLAGFSTTVGVLSGSSGAVISSSAAATLTVSSTANSTYGGIFSGSTSLRKTGPATLTLSGSSTNTGPTLIESGTLALGAPNAISGSSAITLGSGTSFGTLFLGTHNLAVSSLTFTGSGGAIPVSSGSISLQGLSGSSATITVLGGLANAIHPDIVMASNVLIDISSGASLLFHADMSGTGSLTKNGLGRLDIFGDNSGFSGPFTINSGTVKLLGGVAQLGTGTATINTGATLDLNYRPFSGSYVLAGGTLVNIATGTVFVTGTSTISGTATSSTIFQVESTGNATFNDTLNNGYVSILGGGVAAFNGAVTGASSTVVVSPGGTATFALDVGGLVSGTGGMTFNGTIVPLATIDVYGTSAFNGLVSNDADVHIYPGALGTFTGTTAGAVTVDGVATFSNTLAATANLTVTGSGQAQFLNGANFDGADIENAGNLLISNTTPITIAANIGGSGTVTKQGPGIVYLTGTSDGTGAYSVNSGTMSVSGALDGAPISIADVGTFIVAGSGTFGTPTIDNAGSLIFDRSADLTLATAISGTGSFIKNDANLLSLTGNSTYTGPTLVNAGTLAVNGVLGNTSLSVAASAWLQGTGTIGGPVNVLGTLSPGNSPGVLTLASVVLGGSSTTLIEITGTTRETLYDGVNVTGTSSSLTYGGLLSLSFGNVSEFDNDTTFDIFNFTGVHSGTYSTVVSTGFYSGTWSPLGSGTFKLDQGGQTLTFSQATGDIIVVPEPAAIALSIGGIAALADVLRRRYRQRTAARRIA